jgi:hypothetical protein
MGSWHTALELPEIVEAIVRHIPINIQECWETVESNNLDAYHASRDTLRSVALVNRLFSVPALDAFWAVLLDVNTLVRLLRRYQEVCDSCLSSISWSSRNDRATSYLVLHCDAFAKFNGYLLMMMCPSAKSNWSKLFPL